MLVHTFIITPKLPYRSRLKIIFQFFHSLSMESNAIRDPYNLSHKNVIPLIKFYPCRISLIRHYVLHYKTSVLK